MLTFKIHVKIVPKIQPNADSEDFVIDFDEEQTRQLKCANWLKTSDLLTPFIPETHFLVALSQIEPVV